MAVPNSYNDPFWISLASGAESSVGLPDGLLQAVLLRGEKSNANQVSEAGAKTPFQIIPSTRDAALKKYGIDAYLSPENAAEVAARLLKESLDRNKGNQSLAVAEYHGGVNRRNWGPRTKAYVSRVASAATIAPPMAEGGGESTFQRVMSQRQATEEAQPSIANIYAAYESGAMDAEAAAEFEADVRAGVLMLPRGAKLKEAQGQAQGGGAPVGQSFEETGILPKSVADAYQSGRMAREDRIELEADVAAGLVRLPPGVALQKTEPMTLLEKIKEPFTGAERETPTTKQSADWTDLPELQNWKWSSWKTSLGSLLAGPEEIAQVVKANNPEVKVSQDEKGNFILTSPTDGKTYAIKPGFRASDIPKAVAGIAAFTPAGKAATLGGMALGAGATQAAIETSQYATGGTYNPEEIALATALAPAVPATVRGVRSLRALRPRGAATRATQATEAAAMAERQAAISPAGTTTSAQAMPETVPGASIPGAPAAAEAATVPGAQIIESAPYLSAEQLKQTTSKAAQGGMGSKKAFESLAGQAPQNQKTVEAAKRLGIDGYLQPDHTTTSQAYRELTQAIKSIPGSEARAAEIAGLRAVGQRADDLITEIGGLTDMSNLSQGVKNRLQSTVDALEKQAKRAYDQLKNEIPAQTRGNAGGVLGFLETRAKDLDGAENLSSLEKSVLKRLSPKPIFDEAGEVVGEKLPTYSLIDDVRKDIGAAAREKGPFADADVGLAKKLYSLIDGDQFAIADQAGQGGAFKAAKELVRTRKGIEDDMTALFGKWLDQSMVGKLGTATTSLSKGDADKFINILGALPKEMRERVTASALQTAFGKSTQNGNLNFNTFAKWYEGLLENKRAHAAFMSNLPMPARKQISDLYRVSRGIADASKERIVTGRIQGILQDFQGPDSLISKVYSVAQKVIAAVPIPGSGIASGIMSAFSKNKTSAIKAADAMINTPEFQNIVKQSAKTGLPHSKMAIRRLAVSDAFRRYAAEVKLPKEISEQERWIITALQASKTANENPTERKK